MTPELVARLKAYVTSGAHSTSSTDDAFISECLETAIALVNAKCGAAVATTVPIAVLNTVYVEAGAELYNRRASPNGVSQFASPDGGAIRIRRDPLEGVMPMLAPYLPAGFA